MSIQAMKRLIGISTLSDQAHEKSMTWSWVSWRVQTPIKLRDQCGTPRWHAIKPMTISSTGKVAALRLFRSGPMKFFGAGRVAQSIAIPGFKPNASVCEVQRISGRSRSKFGWLLLTQRPCYFLAEFGLHRCRDLPPTETTTALRSSSRRMPMLNWRTRTTNTASVPPAQKS
jgi:hypothetical protein